MEAKFPDAMARRLNQEQADIILLILRQWLDREPATADLIKCAIIEGEEIPSGYEYGLSYEGNIIFYCCKGYDGKLFVPADTI
jgi:hypothetical protein